MASFSLKIDLLSLLAIFANSWMVKAGNPDITCDFLIPTNASAANIDGIRSVLGSSVPKFKVTKASKAEFPALDGQCVSLAILQFATRRVNLPHTHPRSAELLFVLQGTLEVGFVDTTKKLYSESLQVGEMFVFPKGLVNFQYNSDYNSAATAISAFGSANAGTASLPTTLYATGVDDGILAKSFKTDVATIQKIKASLASNAQFGASTCSFLLLSSFVDFHLFYHYEYVANNADSVRDNFFSI